MNAYIVCTEYRGVFFGRSDKTKEEIRDAETADLIGAKMAIRWGTTRGVMQLAKTGPTSESWISLPADISLNKVTAVFAVTKDAEKAWDDA